MTSEFLLKNRYILVDKNLDNFYVFKGPSFYVFKIDNDNIHCLNTSSKIHIFLKNELYDDIKIKDTFSTYNYCFKSKNRFINTKTSNGIVLTPNEYHQEFIIYDPEIIPISEFISSFTLNSEYKNNIEYKREIDISSILDTHENLVKLINNSILAK